MTQSNPSIALPTNMNLAVLMFTQWDELLKKAQSLHFHKDQTLFYEGHTPCGIYIHYSGSVQLSSLVNNNSKKIDASPAAPYVMGLEAVSSDHFFSETCVALTDCKILFLPKILLEEHGFPHKTS